VRLEIAMRRLARVTLLPFPRDDDAFVRHAQLALEDVDSSPEAAPAHLEALLRVDYPGAVVRRRDGLGSFDGLEAWYVYRDGSPNGTPAAVPSRSPS
jgi:hypothetical protein